MRAIAIVPALAFLTGAVVGIVGSELPIRGHALSVMGAVAWLAWIVASARRTSRVADAIVMAVIAIVYIFIGSTLASDAYARATRTPLRTLLNQHPGGFVLETIGSGHRHDPIGIRARLLEDAAPRSEFTALRARVVQMGRGSRWRDTDGEVAITVGGQAALADVRGWRAGRTIETAATFRRPGVYLNEGVPDFERRLALAGTTLLASVKSGLLVGIVSKGHRWSEASAHVRAHVRESVLKWVGRYDAPSAAVVTAILIGDRGNLAEDVQDRLQRAGTYHVIAISGGNIAILAGLALTVLVLSGVTGRAAAITALVVVVMYAAAITAGPSVWRAATMAVVYLGARALDHRTPPWQAMACAALLLVVVRPLDVADVGFLLTFGATAAIVEAARRVTRSGLQHPPWRWLLASIAASAAAELALLPVNAVAFSRVTSAGLALNLAAVPLMAVAQVSGMVVAVFDRIEWVAAPAGWIAYWSTSGLLESARLVDVAPWLSLRVPPPHVALVAAYYVALVGALVLTGKRRVAALVLWALSGTAIVTGYPESWIRAAMHAPVFRVIAFDVGQGDATLLEFPDRTRLLVDAGGSPFGTGAFDIGERVLAPALWSRGIRSLDTIVVTHGDPDHIGGAPTVLNDFEPGSLWQGVPVPTHVGLSGLIEEATSIGTEIEDRRRGDIRRFGPVEVRVLHPAIPDWERPRVRNDDSIVLDVRYGDVAVLLMGDVGTSVERELIPHLRPAKMRILKVGHHGSRTSTSEAFLDAWRPQVAIISCGRGNTFSHPAPEVLQRLEAIGASIYRTDLHGQITLESDGERLDVSTFVGAAQTGGR